MASLPFDYQKHSSTIVEVAQATQPNPTMEHSTKDTIIPSAHYAGSWMSLNQDSYNSLAGFQTQPLTHPHNTNHVLHLLSDNHQQPSDLRYPLPSPVWRVYHPSTASGLCSKRVEDVKMNRIDKLKSGRRRRPCRRPFVFKSSPLAEGQGSGRFTQFRTNTFPEPRSDSFPSTLQSPPGVSPPFPKSQGSIYISRFMDPRDSAIRQRLCDLQLDTSISFSTFNCNVNTLTNGYRQPQISCLRNSKINLEKSSPTQNKNHYQSWEITLPKCPFPKTGMFAN